MSCLAAVRRDTRDILAIPVKLEYDPATHVAHMDSPANKTAEGASNELISTQNSIQIISLASTGNNGDIIWEKYFHYYCSNR